jgi:hypothetical protein
MDQRTQAELVDELKGDQSDPVNRVMGRITAANTTTRSASILFASGSVVSGIKYLDHVTPTVGYVAWMIEVGGDYLIVGTTH